MLKVSVISLIITLKKHQHLQQFVWHFEPVAPHNYAVLWEYAFFYQCRGRRYMPYPWKRVSSLWNCGRMLTAGYDQNKWRQENDKIAVCQRQPIAELTNASPHLLCLLNCLRLQTTRPRQWKCCLETRQCLETSHDCQQPSWCKRCLPVVSFQIFVRK